MQETQVQSLGWEDLLEKEMATHSSILAWRIPWIEEPGRLWSLESQKEKTEQLTLSLSPTLKFTCRLSHDNPVVVDAIRVNYINELRDIMIPSVQFSSVAQSCLTLCDPMNRSTPGLPVHHQLLEFTQTQVHRVSDAIQPSHPLSSPSPPAPNPSQHQSLSQWVNSSHEVHDSIAMLKKGFKKGKGNKRIGETTTTKKCTDTTGS